MFDKINEDIKIAMKNGDKFTLSVLRMLKSAVDQSKTNQRDIPSDEDMVSILRKQVKIRKDSKEEYLKYGNIETAKNLDKEVEILSKYLPEELSDEEINKLLDETFNELNPTSIKDMGLVMKTMTEKIAGRCEMGKISTLVKARLS